MRVEPLAHSESDSMRDAPAPGIEESYPAQGQAGRPAGADSTPPFRSLPRAATPTPSSRRLRVCPWLRPRVTRPALRPRRVLRHRWRGNGHFLDRWAAQPLDARATQAERPEQHLQGRPHPDHRRGVAGQRPQGQTHRLRTFRLFARCSHKRPTPQKNQKNQKNPSSSPGSRPPTLPFV